MSESPSQSKTLKLHLGCGKRFHPAWINLDFTPQVPGVQIHDLREPLPFEDSSVDACYSAHVLGHLNKAETASFLAEQFRVLKPGGVARFAVPDLRQIVMEYLQLIGPLLEGDFTRAADYEWNQIEMHDQMARSDYGGKMAKYLAQKDIPNKDYIISRIGEEGRELMENGDKEAPLVKSRLRPSHLSHYGKKIHRKVIKGMVRVFGGAEMAEAFRLGSFRKFSGEVQWRIYDAYSLSKELREADFDRTLKQSATSSEIPKFSHFNFDTDGDGTVRKPESLFMEAIKS